MIVVQTVQRIAKRLKNVVTYKFLPFYGSSTYIDARKDRQATRFYEIVQIHLKLKL